MRDALSLLDQAIAYGAGEVRDAVVREMLGTVDTDYAYRIVEALLAGDGAALLAECDAMTARSLAFAPALEELAALLHRIAIAQVVPAAAEAFDDAERVTGSRCAGCRPRRSSSATRSPSRAAPTSRWPPTRRWVSR